MTTPEAGGYRTPLEAVRALALQVDRTTVLKARSALLDEANRLDVELDRSKHGGEVGLCGGDPVSPEAAKAFNVRIGAMIASCRAYNRDLRAAALALDATARAYGYTDDEIAASYRPGS